MPRHRDDPNMQDSKQGIKQKGPAQARPFNHARLNPSITGVSGWMTNPKFEIRNLLVFFFLVG
jgi:hypothetical protein